MCFGCHSELFTNQRRCFNDERDADEIDRALHPVGGIGGEVLQRTRQEIEQLSGKVGAASFDSLKRSAGSGHGSAIGSGCSKPASFPIFVNDMLLASAAAEFSRGDRIDCLDYLAFGQRRTAALAIPASDQVQCNKRVELAQ